MRFPPKFITRSTVFLASGANLSRAADGLLLHRNSMTYRLERVGNSPG
jgi:sugar diacid utilization regulator